MPTYLVILLHGVGADAASFQPLARALAQGLPQAEFLVPDGFHPFDGGGGGRQWFSLSGITEETRPLRVKAAAEEVSRYIDAELARRKLGGDRLVLVGFSQGAIVAASVTLHRRPAPAALVMLSGRVSEASSPVAGAVSTPVLVAHGEADPRIPVDYAPDSARLLGAWGAKVTVRRYRGVGHEVSPEELRDVQAFLAEVLR
ncbi:MAG: dienelactone hydrolase family protein [Anaeromyxobacteraceae bacterium]